MCKIKTNSRHPNPHLLKYNDDFHVNVDSGLKGIKKEKKTLLWHKQEGNI